MYSSPSPPPADPFTRRKPRCSKCGLAMAGHKRPDGSPICPNLISPEQSVNSDEEGSLLDDDDGSSLHTPPPSPPPHFAPLESRFPVARRSSATLISSSQAHHDPFDFPERGPFHRRNPNWVPTESVPTSRTITTKARNSNDDEDDDDSTNRSDSTILVDDDGKTIRGSDLANFDIDDGASVSSDFFDQLGAKMNSNNNNKRAIVTLFATQRTNPSRSQQLAAKQGMHAGLVKLSDRNDPRYGSWWMAVGRDPKAVYRVMSGTEGQTRMPGVMNDLKMEGPRLTTFLELVFAGIVAGIVVVCVLARV